MPQCGSIGQHEARADVVDALFAIKPQFLCADDFQTGHACRSGCEGQVSVLFANYDARITQVEVQDKDRDAVREIPGILAEEGFQIIKPGDDQESSEPGQ